MLWPVGAFNLTDQEFELFDFFAEGNSSSFRYRDPSAGAFALLALFEGDHSGGFQHAQVLGEVPTSQFEIGA